MHFFDRPTFDLMHFRWRIHRNPPVAPVVARRPLGFQRVARIARERHHVAHGHCVGRHNVAPPSCVCRFSFTPFSLDTSTVPPGLNHL